MYRLNMQTIGSVNKPALCPTMDECNINYYMNKGLSVNGLLIDNVGIVSPIVGDIKMSVRATDYEGWLLCDGGDVLQEQYPDLYELIGNAFGVAESEGYFRLPDARGRVLGSVQSNGTSYYCVGDERGSESITLTTGQLAQHNHGVTDPGHLHTGTTNAGGVHTHTSNAVGGQGNLGLCIADGEDTASAADPSVGELNVWTTPRALTIDNSTSHTHTFTSDTNTTGITTNNTGSNDPVYIMQPTLFIGNTFIYSGVRDTRKEFPCVVVDPVIQPCLD